MAIKNIIFDLGNVILTNDWHHDYPEIYKEFSDYFNISYDDMEKGWNAFWPKFKIGGISEEEFWSGFLGIAGAKNLDTEQAKKLWRKYQRPIESMFDLLERLKKNYRLSALANVGKEWFDYKRKKYNLDSYFDIIITSAYSGLAKPDPKIYDLIIRKLDTNPKECLFIDDQEKPLLVAENMGIETILFINQSKLERKFRELGIKI